MLVFGKLTLAYDDPVSNVHKGRWLKGDLISFKDFMDKSTWT